MSGSVNDRGNNVAGGDKIRGMKTGFRELDFSGDVGIEAWGGTEAEVLEQAALGLFSLMAAGPVKRSVERRVFVGSTGGADRVVDWLNELIAEASLHGEVYGDAAVTLTPEGAIEAVIRGETIDERVHELRFDVKAATYHDLEFRKTAAGFRARIVFDL